MRYRHVVLFVTLAAAAACASAGGPGNPGERRSADVITAAEIQKVTGLTTAYDAVQRLRPQFLRTHGRSTFVGSEGIVVYVDGMQRGDLDALRQIGINDVKEIRYVNARDATTKYGTGVNQGVIEVLTH